MSVVRINIESNLYSANSYVLLKLRVKGFSTMPELPGFFLSSGIFTIINSGYLCLLYENIRFNSSQSSLDITGYIYSYKLPILLLFCCKYFLSSLL